MGVADGTRPPVILPACPTPPTSRCGPREGRSWRASCGPPRRARRGCSWCTGSAAARRTTPTSPSGSRRPAWRRSRSTCAATAPAPAASTGARSTTSLAGLDALAARGHAPLGARGSSMGGLLALHAAPGRPARPGRRRDLPRPPGAPGRAHRRGVAPPAVARAAPEARRRRPRVLARDRRRPRALGRDLRPGEQDPATGAPARRHRREPRQPAARPGDPRRDRRLPREVARVSRAGLEALEAEIVACRSCPRLVAWREEVGRVKRRAFADQEYWARPVPGFGDPDPWLVLVGLAPSAHGANRTGRVFTGDPSGDVLYAALWRAGLASQPQSVARGDGMRLSGCRVTAAVRCAPPDNRPAPDERDRCRPYLVRELALLPGRPRAAGARRGGLGRRPARARRAAAVAALRPRRRGAAGGPASCSAATTRARRTSPPGGSRRRCSTTCSPAPGSSPRVRADPCC